MKTLRLLPATALALAFVSALGSAAAGNKKTDAPAFWTWDFVALNFAQPAGSTKLVRTPGGINANFKTSGLMAGHAVTLWIMFFNNPEGCATTPCSPADMMNPDAQFDFHYAGGRIVNSSNTTIGGHLSVNDTSGSGLSEIGLPQFAAALTNPLGAEVLLAIHSHGPVQSGQNLADQMSSYLGGCQLPFLGDPNGFAQSASDIPALVGECSTIQIAAHLP